MGNNPVESPEPQDRQQVTDARVASAPQDPVSRGRVERTARALPVPSLWMDAEEAAAHLRLPSRSALYSAVARGSLPVHRLGRRVRFLRSELDHALRTGGLPR